ncbi:Uu.00g071290.m01.CDS01 [Anthostomella pinea]|uniref:Uu.00g071290.m01.CDS01 n=1 Tax=Anthostomella pinea TaxID=933095 RepID=A0AAI8VVM7_9PEZI|nr:Uu.00g071290.m01.CDS01 [Anthostomella pinea]
MFTQVNGLTVHLAGSRAFFGQDQVGSTQALMMPSSLLQTDDLSEAAGTITGPHYAPTQSASSSRPLLTVLQLPGTAQLLQQGKSGIPQLPAPTQASGSFSSPRGYRHLMLCQL